MSEPAIELRGVTKTFGKTRAVSDLDLVVPTGSICGFLGPNGAGKSTTIRMIMSIIYPDSGEVRVLGGSALRNKDRIGYLPEERGVYRKMRVGDFLKYNARLKGMPREGLKQHVLDWLERLELPDTYRKRNEELSKGMQQKVQFIASVIHDPDLLILDEPFSGLDPVNARLLNELIRDMRDKGKTIIFSTHVLHQAEQICDRIFLIHKGVKLLDATLDEIRVHFDPRTIVTEPLNGTADFSDIAGIAGVHPLKDSASIELTLADGADPQRIMQTIIETRPTRSVELRRLTLDEVFVRLVLRGEGEQAAELAREELSHV